MLHYDFLSPTVAVMLFSDLFQQFVPYGFLNDRAIALERSVQAAWNFCEEGAWFGHPFRSLWANSPPYAVPLLFLNSTVVETGQRLIAAPVAIKELAGQAARPDYRTLGPEVPLSRCGARRRTSPTSAPLAPCVRSTTPVPRG